MMHSLLHEQTKQWKGEVSFWRFVLIENDLLFGGLCHLENVGDSGCNYPYNNTLLKFIDYTATSLFCLISLLAI